VDAGVPTAFAPAKTSLIHAARPVTVTVFSQAMADSEKTDVPSASASADAPASDPSGPPSPNPGAASSASSPNAAIPPPAEGGATGELEKLRKERDENYNRYLRAVADLDTYRRRMAREKDELRQFANRDLLESLLPVYEHLALAIASSQQAKDAESIAKGVALVLEQFRAALAAKGLVEINPAPGADFDPHQHESIGHAPHPTIPEEKIVQLVRAGFSLSGRVLRPASVLLSSGPAKAQEPAVI
jgi:molecular chaperone GrpE